ncbi:MAG: pectin methylesterase [Clostridia bacterium]|nr:pectin methylesterase [Clostridia bacterium]
MYLVAKDGSGDFASIQAAVDAVPAGQAAHIHILPGVYEERVILNKSRVRLTGEDRKNTVITHSACAKDRYPDGKEKGTFLSFSVLVTGDDVTVENLTIRNEAGDGSVVGQAVAVFAAGDRGVWRNCDLIAHQDTLFCGPVMANVLAEMAPYESTAECAVYSPDSPLTHSRQYFENCFIRGDVDYIFGPYRCWFEGCTLYMNARGGWYTAANTPQDQPYGFVFHRCRLTGECPAGTGYLGRPWRKYARTVFLHCDMDACVAPWGFCDWDENRTVNERLGEYGTTGVRSDLSARHPLQKRLTAQEAQAITIERVLNGWQPAERTAP